MNKNLIFILMIFNSLVFAGIPKERRLKKLSMHIKGVNPTMNEYKKVGKLEDEFIEQYFKVYKGIKKYKS